MKIVTIYNPFLRKTVEPVKVFDGQLKKEAQEMLKLMHQGNGIGLAGNQVELNKRLIVMEYVSPDKKSQSVPRLILVNPQIVKLSRQTDEMNEGCLSLPAIELPVTRPSGVVVKAQDLNGKTITVKAKGLTARVIQHEIDHLNGVLFTDHIDAKIINDYRWYSNLKVVFAGSDEFSLPCAKMLCEIFPNIVIMTEKAKPSGRGKIIQDNPISLWAKSQGINLIEIEQKHEISNLLKSFQPHIAILASFGRIIDEESLSLPTYGWLNLHPSLLPKYRGASPIQTAILNGDKETGISIIQMRQEVDKGAILKQKVYRMTENKGFIELRKDLANQAAEALLETLPAYLTGRVLLREQAENEASYAGRLKKEDGEINWNKSVEEIYCQIKAFEQWPLSYTYLEGKRLIIRKAHLEKGQLALDEVQLEGKKPSSWSDFVKGNKTRLMKESWFAKII